MVDIFDVISDATRRDLLDLLRDRPRGGSSIGSATSPSELSVGEMVDRLGLSQPTVSKHLRVLRDNGLVAVRDSGQRRYYRLDPTALNAVEDWLVPFLASGVDVPSVDVPSAVARERSSEGLADERTAVPVTVAGEAGVSLGRAVAGATHHAKAVLDDAAIGVQARVITPIRRVLGK